MENNSSESSLNHKCVLVRPHKGCNGKIRDHLWLSCFVLLFISLFVTTECEEMCVDGAAQKHMMAPEDFFVGIKLNSDEVSPPEVDVSALHLSPQC